MSSTIEEETSYQMQMTHSPRPLQTFTDWQSQNEIGRLAIAWWRADQHVAEVEAALPPVPASDRKRYKLWKQAQKNAEGAWDAFQRALVRFEPPAQEDMFE